MLPRVHIVRRVDVVPRDNGSSPTRANEILEFRTYFGGHVCTCPKLFWGVYKFGGILH